MVKGMSPTERSTVVSRLRESVTREEEDLQDWLRGSGQVWLGVLGFIFLAFLLWNVLNG
jgi:hypothetical protein